MRQLRVAKYGPDYKSIWDDFVRSSKNGTFLFFRDYTEYHADRFTDNSLLFFEDDELIALLPASFSDGIAVSHGGLTYGGIVSGRSMKTSSMLLVFNAMIATLREAGVTQLIYKAVPHIYHRLPSEEDLYALHVNGAQLIRRDVSTAILMQERIAFSKGRRSEIKKGANLTVSQTDDFDNFMQIEEEVLRERHNKKPVHTAAELASLSRAFSNHIKLFAAHKDGQMLGGVVIYEDEVVAHAQYISANAEGKRSGAQDVILDYLINEYYRDKRYFDFGISTEDESRYLNLGLQQNKESYGARAIVYDFYKLDLLP